MSQEIEAQVWKLKNIDKLAKFVLVKIADNYNEADEIAWPSVAYLVEHLSMSERAVQRAISDFIKSGVLVVVGNEKGGRGSREYTIDLDRARAIHGVIKKRKYTRGNGQRAQSAENGTPAPQADDTDAEPRGAPQAPPSEGDLRGAPGAPPPADEGCPRGTRTFT